MGKYALRKLYPSASNTAAGRDSTVLENNPFPPAYHIIYAQIGEIIAQMLQKIMTFCGKKCNMNTVYT